MLMHNKQTKPSFYSYGNLIASNTNKFLKESNFFIKPSFGLLIKNIYGFDLDNIFDLKVAQQLVKKKLIIMSKILICKSIKLYSIPKFFEKKILAHNFKNEFYIKKKMKKSLE